MKANRWTISAVAALVAVLCLLCTAGCGSGGGTAPIRNIVPPTGLMQLTIGDAPGDRIAAFAVPVNSVSLTSTGATQTSILSSSVTIEMTHLVGTTAPLATLTIPTGTYSQASITLGSPQITILDPATGLASQKTAPAPPTSITVTLSPQFQLATSPMVLTLELSLSKSIAVDTLGNITFTPVFVTTQSALATGTTPATPFNGGLDVTVGKVTSVSATSFTLQPAISGPPITLAVSSTTQFFNASGIGQVLVGMVVSAAGQTQTDGSFLATRLTVLNALTTSQALVGQVATVTGSPATQVQVVELGTGAVTLAAPPLVGSAVTVDVLTGNPAFRFDSTDFDFTALPFAPSFSTAANLKLAQVVEMDTTTPLLGLGGAMLSLPVVFTITPSQVQLQPQALIGTVSNFSANSFTLTVPTDSVFATLTRTTALTVFTQSKTSLTNLSAITNGSTVIVRGLLFFDSNAYKLVASRIMPAP